MDLALDDNQQELAHLAADTFGRLSTPERLDAIEQSAERFDADLWKELARTGLLGVAIAEQHDGLGFGLVELAVVLEELGKTTAAVPMVGTAVAALVIAEHGTDEQQQRWLPAIARGEAVIAIAAPQSLVGVTASGTTISGEAIGVAWTRVADALLLPIGDQLLLVDPSASGITSASGLTTAREVALDLRFDDVAAERIGDGAAPGYLRDRWLTCLAATQAGVCDGALRLAASYTSERQQFGKPLSSFQGVALKAADGYVDVAAIRSVTRQAAWLLENAADARLAVLTAAWWAAEGGQHCVHITQHLHGGMGADITYPVHRFFLLGKQIELLTGGASALLAELGDVLVDSPRAGDNLVLT